MAKYQVLPLNFKSVDGENTLLINQAGEYFKISNPDFESLCSLTLSKDNSTYSALKAKHFLADNAANLELAINMLATKLRTRKAFINDFTALHMIVVTLRCNCLCRYCHASSVDLNKKEYAKTINVLERAVLLDNKNTANINNLGVAYFNLGNTNKAEQIWLNGTKAAKLNPDVYNNLIMLYLDDKKDKALELARELIDKGGKLRPAYQVALFGR